MNLNIDCILIITILFVFFENQSAQNDIDCQAIKTKWYSHKYPYSDDLLKFTPPKSVDAMCPKKKTCCDSLMKTEILGVSQMKLKSIAEIHLKSIIELLYNNSRDLNDFYQTNLDLSKNQLNQMFLSTYTTSYKTHQPFFFGFYEKLKLYLDGKEQNIEKTLETFFNEMAEKILTMMVLSKKSPDVIRCLTNNFLKFNPYQNADKAVISNFKEAYPTARMLVNSLRAAHDIFLDLSKKLVPSIDCSTQYAKAFYCSWCSLTETMPCDGLCKSIIGKCFGSFNSKEMNRLNKVWKALLGAMEKISKKLKHPFNIVEVNKNLHVKISDAIMNVHNFYPNIRDKLSATCGNPLVRKRRSEDENENENPSFESSPKILENIQLKSILLPDLVDKFLTKMKDMIPHLQKYKTIICSNTFKLPKQGNQCWNGDEIKTGYKPNLKEKGGNKNLEISTVVKTSVAKLQNITAVLNNILSKKVVDPDAFKINFVEKPKITEIPRLRPSRISELIIEGSGKGGVDIENSNIKSKPNLSNLETNNKPNEIIEGSGKIKMPDNQIPTNRPVFLELSPSNIYTPKPDNVIKLTPAPDDEDLSTDQNENEKIQKPVEGRKTQIEGSGSLETFAKSTETPKAFTTKTTTTIKPIVITDPIKSSQIHRPDDESSISEGSGQEEITPRKGNEFISKIESVLETTTLIPAEGVTSQSVLLPNDLPGEIPSEIWIPRVVDYDSRGQLVNNPDSTASFAKLFIAKLYSALFFSLYVIYKLL